MDSKMGGRRRRKQSRKTQKSRKPMKNNALREWVNFVKKVRAEEKIDSYKKAMSRAKVRADKGEKWRSMKGGEGDDEEAGAEPVPPPLEEEEDTDITDTTFEDPTKEAANTDITDTTFEDPTKEAANTEKFEGGNPLKGGLIFGGRRRSRRSSRSRSRGRSRSKSRRRSRR